MVEINDDYILRVRNMSKLFPGVQALDRVSFNLKNGEVLGLLGQNGAGKSTLIKIISGDYRLESGEMIFNGKSVIFNSPFESLSQGIRVIYQELDAYDTLSVAENIFGGEIISNKIGLVCWKKMFNESCGILKELKVEINPNELMENLTVAEKQIVEIAKALKKKAKIVIMDEPTSAINKREV